MKVPFLLNSAQCKLCLGEYYAAIEKCNAVLEIDKGNNNFHLRRMKMIKANIICIMGKIGVPNSYAINPSEKLAFE